MSAKAKLSPGTRIGGLIVCADGRRRKPRTLLEMVKERITARPQDYDQRASCGTPGCIGGHAAMIIFGPPSYLYYGLDDVAEVLGCAFGWPWLFECNDERIRPAIELRTAKARAAAACRAIDAFIEERGL